MTMTSQEEIKRKISLAMIQSEGEIVDCVMRDANGEPRGPTPENLAMFEKAVQSLIKDGFLERLPDGRIRLTELGRVQGEITLGRTIADGDHRTQRLEPPQ